MGVFVVPQAAIELAKRFEGFHKVPRNDPQGCAYPYICPAGFWTIGFGHLCTSDHPPISEDEGEIYLNNDLRTALNATLRYCPVLTTDIPYALFLIYISKLLPTDHSSPARICSHRPELHPALLLAFGAAKTWP
jgi:hypothetical protein